MALLHHCSAFSFCFNPSVKWKKNAKNLYCEDEFWSILSRSVKSTNQLFFGMNINFSSVNRAYMLPNAQKMFIWACCWGKKLHWA